MRMCTRNVGMRMGVCCMIETVARGNRKLAGCNNTSNKTSSNHLPFRQKDVRLTSLVLAADTYRCL